jgi:hypothetical protein
MRKITCLLIFALSVTAVNGFATDKNKKGNTKGKAPAKCAMQSCCKKSTSRAALLKAKPVKKP